MNNIYDLAPQQSEQIVAKIRALLPAKLKTVLNELIAIGCRPVIFGGFVRDLYLDVQPKDIDLFLFLPNEQDKQVHEYFNANCFNLNGLVYKNTIDGLDCDIVLQATTYQNLFDDKNTIRILLENISQTLDFNLNALFFDCAELLLINNNLSFDMITTLKNATESFNESPERCLINLPKLIAKFPKISLHPDILKSLAQFDESVLAARNINFWRKIYQSISTSCNDFFIKILFDGLPLNDSKKFIPANYLFFGMEYPVSVQQVTKELLLEFSKYLLKQKNKNTKNLYIIFNVLLLIAPYIAEKKQIELFGGFDLAVIRNKLVYAQYEMLHYSNGWLQQIETLLENYFIFFDDNSKIIEDELLLLLAAIIPFDSVKTIYSEITAKSLVEKRLIKEANLTSVHINAPLLVTTSQQASHFQLHDKQRVIPVETESGKQILVASAKAKQNADVEKPVVNYIQQPKKRSQKTNHSVTSKNNAAQTVAPVVITASAADKVEVEKLKQQQDEVERYQRSQDIIAAANSISSTMGYPEPIAQTVKPARLKRKHKLQTDNVVKEPEIKSTFFKQTLQNAAIFSGCIFALTAVFIRATLPTHQDPGLKEYAQVSVVTFAAFLLYLIYENSLKFRRDNTYLTNNYLVKTLFSSKQDDAVVSIENSADSSNVKQMPKI